MECTKNDIRNLHNNQRDSEMISHNALAKNISKLISKRDKNDTHISTENKVSQGIRYITFTAMSNDACRNSYSMFAMIADILGMDERQQTFANPHFINEWQAIKVRLLESIDDEEQTPIVLSGHGVAGSVALMAGYYLTMHDKNLLKVVTFGAPAGLNKKKTHKPFCRVLQPKTTQYIFARDPIANMFKWTKYGSLSRTELNILDRNRKKLSIYSYIDSMGVDSA